MTFFPKKQGPVPFRRGGEHLIEIFRIFFKHFIIPTVIIAMVTSQARLWACGSIEEWIEVYSRGEKYKALHHMLDCADSYKVPADDVALLPVIEDALENNGRVAAIAKQVFRYFNHLWGARNKPAYAGVFRAVTGNSDWERMADYQGWMVVTAVSGANMREGPFLNSPVITAVKYGMQVKVFENQGEWIKVRPVGPGAVDSRFEGKTGYIHESLLTDY